MLATAGNYNHFTLAAAAAASSSGKSLNVYTMETQHRIHTYLLTVQVQTWGTWEMPTSWGLAAM